METQTPSLLDWLKYKFAEVRTQRAVRFGLAGLLAAWGLLQFARGASLAAALFFLGLALAALLWGLAARGEAAGTLALPELSVGGIRPGLPPVAGVAGRVRAVSPAMWQAVRLLGAVLLAVFGQAVFNHQRSGVLWGLVLYAGGLTAFVWLLWRDDLLRPGRAAGAEAGEMAAPLAVRTWPLAAAAVAGLLAFALAGNNQFRWSGVLAWIVSVGAWLLAVWEGQVGLEAWKARIRAWTSREEVTLRVTPWVVVFLAILAVGAYFRFSRLQAIPPEMTSDHVEKLMDVNDILHLQPYVFLERNTGREPMQFYSAAVVLKVLGTGLTHFTLKIVTSTAGLLLLPFVYLLGRELEDKRFGLLAMLLVAVSFWATAISRVGLRFPLTPLFVAPVMFFLLRGLRRVTQAGARNDFILAGLFLGIGLYGYSTIRVLPVLIAAAIGLYALWPNGRRAWPQIFANSVLLFATTFVVFIPLFRYATQEGNLFWYRTISRLGETEATIQGSPLAIFLQNQWNAALMFNWKGDDVWTNTVPEVPVLDFVAGALFILGLVYLAARLIRQRDRAAAVLLIALPILMLPSTLSVTFPEENPSVVRTSGAIPIVYAIAAYPLWLVYRKFSASLPAPRGRWAAVAAAGLLVWAGAAVNHNLYFVRYPPQYAHAAQNASEMGAVIKAFAGTIGSFETAAVRPFPFWVDTRAVGMYADNFGWDAAIQKEELARMQSDPRPRMIILHPHDQETIAELRQLYPTGALSVYRSAVPDHDFLIYFIPGTEDLNVGALP